MTSAPTTGAALAKAAETLVGARFRMHGRDPATGLDCVGVLAAALAKAGYSARLPISYTLKMRELEPFTCLAGACGFVPADGGTAPGDVVMFHVGPCQYHLAIAAQDGGFIHAHAGLRRVVHSARLPEWPVEGHWRIAPSDINAPSDIKES